MVFTFRGGYFRLHHYQKQLVRKVTNKSTTGSRLRFGTLLLGRTTLLINILPVSNTIDQDDIL